MPDRRFRRPAHESVVALLRKLDRSFLDRCECHFGGGTRIVLELGEYRESRDVDFLCASRDGYRLLREAVSERSLGPVEAKGISLAREVRADQYGIRTWLAAGEFRIKFEILRESRIDLSGAKVAGIPVTCLDREHAFAEKFLANADRGLDASTLSRDAVDLAFMIEGWSAKAAADGLAIARSAYGTVADRKLVAVTTKLREDKAWRNRVVTGLAIEDTKTLSAGLAQLARESWRRESPR